MMKMRWIVMSVLVLGVLLSAVGVLPQNSNEVGKLRESVAYFDYFSYTGDDDFYKENPLPGPDYFYNPILPGWYSDPSVCSNGEDFFLVTSTFSYYPGVPLFHSKDLVNWTQVGHILNRPEQLPLEGQRVSEGIFAPAISYNPANATYYMITTNIRRGNFLVKTQDPFGDWSDPIWLPDVQGIDPSLFFDDDGRAYIVYNSEPDGGSQYDGHRAISIVEFNVVNDKTIGPRKMLINGGVDLNEKPVWIEGPHLYKVNGKYLLMCAEGGTSVNHREVIFEGTGPMGTFTPWEKNPILTQKHLSADRPHPITCAGHADLIQKGEEWWSFFLACRPIDNRFENLGRETFLMPVRWSADGFPLMTEGNETIPLIVQMNGTKRNDDITFGNFNIKDDFLTKELSHQWHTLRGAAQGQYTLSEKSGFLTIPCANVSSRELAELPFVSRRLQHHRFESKTKLHFVPASEGEHAGMLLFKDEAHQYFLAAGRVNGKERITLYELSGTGHKELGTVEWPLNGEAVYLKVASDGHSFSFFASANDREWSAVATDVDAFYLSTTNSFGFTGTNIGMYATRKL